MSLIGFSVCLGRIDESLLFQDPNGNYWLNCVCTPDTDSKGRTIVAQSLPKERYAAGERAPTLGTWRELGGSKPTQGGKPAFDLSKYKTGNQKPPPPKSEEPLFPDEDEVP